MNTLIPTTVVLAAISGQLCAQLHTVVPQQFATTDAIHTAAVPGVVDQRTQVLVGASHLTSMIGQNIEAIEFRRSAATEIFTGGAINLTMKLSIAPHEPLACSNVFSSNIGPNPSTVFNGQITIPTSQANAGPTVTWITNNVVRIPVSPAFNYSGGTLCIDIVGQPTSSQGSPWWPADAAFEHIPGTFVDIGGGCGGIGGTQGNWSTIESPSLVVGGHAKMIAHGTPYGLAIAAIGTQSSPIPLSSLGFTPPTACSLLVFPVDILIPMLFVPDTQPAYSQNGGRADLSIKIPNIPGAQGLTLTTQWFDWTQQATSNALTWTIAASVPTLDMASIEGHPLSTKGSTSVHIAPVLRFEHQ